MPHGLCPQPQHDEIRRTVRDFAEREIAPVADEMERRGEFPHEIIRKAAGLGLLGVPYPEEVGGTGLDSLAYAITVEELSRVSRQRRDHRQRPHQPRLRPALHLAGTESRRSATCAPWPAAPKLGAYGLTEPGAGSDSRGTRTRAHRDGD